MPKDYFEEQHEKNRNTLVTLLKAIVSGLVRVTTLTITKNLQGDDYRLVMFFRKKGDK